MFASNPLLDALLRGLILTSAALCWLVLLVRVNGLRSFSKMTSFDFAMTIAVGSLLAGSGQSTDVSALVQSLAGLVSLFALQAGAARLRSASGAFERKTTNQPTVLMRDGILLHDVLAKVRVTEKELMSKLREANVLSLRDVRAVVLETTGDFSVLQGDDLEPRMLLGTEAETP